MTGGADEPGEDREPQGPGGTAPAGPPASPGEVTDGGTGAAAGSDGRARGVAPADAVTATRGRRIWVRVILGVATFLAVLAILAIWVNRQLMEPENWANTSTELLQKQTIRSALASYLVDQLYAHVDVQGEIKSGLPGELRPLAGPVSGALHGVAEQGAEKVLEVPRVQDAWRNANRAADATLVAIIKGGGKRVQINGGTVELNLRQVVAELSDRIGLPSDLAQKLPASVAHVKVVTSHQLGVVRNAAKGLRALAVVLTVIVFLLYVLAVYLAEGRRRRTLMMVGVSLVLAGLIVLIARKIGQGQIVSAVTKDASIEPAANDAYSVATSLLAQVASSSIIIGAATMLCAWFAGPARWAVAGRRFWAPHLRERPALAYWSTAALLALIFIWGPIPATRNPFEMLLFTILAFVGAHVLREQIAAEFPAEEAVGMRAALADYAHHVGEKVSSIRAATSAPRHDAAPSTAGELERLLALREKGAITEEEYRAAKAGVLAGK
jgi:hypothetical protein